MLYLEALYTVGAGSKALCHAVQLLVIITILSLFADLQLIERGHTHIDVALLKEGSAVAEQEGEEQSPDVCTVDICIC